MCIKLRTGHPEAIKIDFNTSLSLTVIELQVLEEAATECICYNFKLM